MANDIGGTRKVEELPCVVQTMQLRVSFKMLNRLNIQKRRDISVHKNNDEKSHFLFLVDKMRETTSNGNSTNSHVILHKGGD